MEFTINKGDIHNVLSKIQGLTNRKMDLAITETVLIRTTETGISLVATDLETTMEGQYPADVESQGEFAINAKKFYEIVRDFPDDEIPVKEVKKRWIKIGGQNIEYHIMGMDPDAFPKTPRIEAVDFFEMDSRALKRMIEKTLIIIGAIGDKRAHITGVFFKQMASDKKIEMVSTDGSRLALVEYRYDNDAVLSDLDMGNIIPKKGLNEVSKFLDSDRAVQIGFQDNHFIVRRDKETISVRLLEGNFPMYRDIIIKGDGHMVRVDRQLFLMMLRRMSILSSDTYKGVIFNFGQNRLLVSASNPDIGDSKEEMFIDFDGETIEVAFNPKYLIETLNVIEDDGVILNIIDERRPCIIEGENDKSFLSVVMPMRI